MKKLNVAKPENRRFTTLLITLMSIVMLVSSCNTDEPVPDEDLGMDLPSIFYGEWKNESNEVIFTVTSSSIGYGGNIYEYEKENVSVSSNIYEVRLSTISFTFTETSDDNSIAIGLGGSLTVYYSEIPELSLPDTFIGHWYGENQASSSSYFIAADYIKTAGAQFYYGGTDVTQSGNIYTIEGTSANNTVYTFRIEEEGDQLRIERNGEGFTTYWDTPAEEFPSNYYGGWYNYAKTWRYQISENSGNSYVKVGNVSYYFGGRDLIPLEDNVLKVKGESSSGVAKTFFLKGNDEGELFISEVSDYNNNFVLHWNDRVIVPVIPDELFKKWFEASQSTMTYRLVNEDDQFLVRDLSDGTVDEFLFDPSKGDVKKIDENNFRVVGDHNGTNRTYYLRQTDDMNRLQVSISNSSNYLNYYNGTGRSVRRVDIDGGYIQYISGDRWGGYNENGELVANYTFKSRDDWSVYFNEFNMKIDMWLKKLVVSVGGATGSEDILSWETK